jgi:hypothetical protein
MEPDGKRDVVVANAPDPKESFHHGQANPQRKGPAPAKQNSSGTSRELPHRQDDGAVNFSFQMAPNSPWCKDLNFGSASAAA